MVYTDRSNSGLGANQLSFTHCAFAVLADPQRLKRFDCQPIASQVPTPVICAGQPCLALLIRLPLLFGMRIPPCLRIGSVGVFASTAPTSPPIAGVSAVLGSRFRTSFPHTCSIEKLSLSSGQARSGRVGVPAAQADLERVCERIHEVRVAGVPDTADAAVPADLAHPRRLRDAAGHAAEVTEREGVPVGVEDRGPLRDFHVVPRDAGDAAGAHLRLTGEPDLVLQERVEVVALLDPSPAVRHDLPGLLLHLALEVQEQVEAEDRGSRVPSGGLPELLTGDTGVHATERARGV